MEPEFLLPDNQKNITAYRNLKLKIGNKELYNFKQLIFKLGGEIINVFCLDAMINRQPAEPREMQSNTFFIRAQYQENNSLDFNKKITKDDFSYTTPLANKATKSNKSKELYEYSSRRDILDFYSDKAKVIAMLQDDLDARQVVNDENFNEKSIDFKSINSIVIDFNKGLKISDEPHDYLKYFEFAVDRFVEFNIVYDSLNYSVKNIVFNVNSTCQLPLPHMEINHDKQLSTYSFYMDTKRFLTLTWTALCEKTGNKTDSGNEFHHKVVNQSRLNAKNYNNYCMVEGGLADRNREVFKLFAKTIYGIPFLSVCIAHYNVLINWLNDIKCQKYSNYYMPAVEIEYVLNVIANYINYDLLFNRNAYNQIGLEKLINRLSGRKNSAYHVIVELKIEEDKYLSLCHELEAFETVVLLSQESYLFYDKSLVDLINHIDLTNYCNNQVDENKKYTMAQVNNFFKSPVSVLDQEIKAGKFDNDKISENDSKPVKKIKLNDWKFFPVSEDEQQQYSENTTENDVESNFYYF